MGAVNNFSSPRMKYSALNAPATQLVMRSFLVNSMQGEEFKIVLLVKPTKRI